MKIKYLYHGSNSFIKGFLNPNKAGDKNSKENCLFAVYATDREDVAKAMALTSTKNTRSFADYEEKDFKVAFLKGEPKKGNYYVYKISSKGFKEKPKNSHQWVSKNNVKIIKTDKYNLKDLKDYWRKATPEEKLKYPEYSK